MFGGLIEVVGEIKERNYHQDNLVLTISHHGKFDDIKLGDSVSVNGVCLTVTQFDASSFNVAVVPETLRLTKFETCLVGEKVNLERSLKVGDRIGGHYVQGHVDGVGVITEIKSDGAGAILMTLSAPKPLMYGIVKKGYVTLDGMSITVAKVNQNNFTVTFIPHTRSVTIVDDYKVGDKINLELDVFLKQRSCNETGTHFTLD